MGLPIYVAATVLSINHVNSLRVESESRAPGEVAQFVGVRYSAKFPRKKKQLLFTESIVHSHQNRGTKLGSKVGGQRTTSRKISLMKSATFLGRAVC